MSLEIDSVIADAMAGLDDGGSDGGTDDGSVGDVGTDSGDTTDLSTADSTDETTDAVDPDTTDDASGQPPEPSAADAKRIADEAAFDAELAELGLAAPKPGQRDNRIPYSRIRKIVANAKTKWSEKLSGEHKTALTAQEAKVQAFEQRAKEFDQAEHLIETDPERYIGLLAQIYPKQYKAFLKDQKADAAQPTPNVRPGPDAKYEDGSLGYTPEQHEKLLDWLRADAVRETEERLDKKYSERFGPIEQAYKTSQAEQQKVQTVRGHIGKLREQWGADQIDNPEVQKAIVKHMDDNPKVSLVESTRVVMMGRIQADRTSMRAELLKELKGAPKAAAKAPAAPNKSGADASTETIEDVIRNSMRGLK